MKRKRAIKKYFKKIKVRKENYTRKPIGKRMLARKNIEKKRKKFYLIV